MSEHADQFEERDQAGQGDSSCDTGSKPQVGRSSPGGTGGRSYEGDVGENGGGRSSEEPPPSRGDLPGEEDRKEGSRQGNRESGTDESGAQQGDVAHEGDLPTETVPEAD